MPLYYLFLGRENNKNEFVSHHLMSRAILKTVNVNIFSKSFDREKNMVNDGIKQAWKQKDLERNLGVPTVSPLTPPPKPSSSLHFL